jgi:hypothetical protein
LYLQLLRDPKLWALLLVFDEDLAREVRAAGCAVCGGALHSARYPRKSRGGPTGLGAEHDRRLSFCCSSDGCRRRRTPRSVRFFGRRVYVGVVFVLVSAMRHGTTADRVRELRAQIGVSRRTLGRWRTWWTETFPATAFWKTARARFSPPVRSGRLSASLVERFLPPAEAERIVALLAFLSPLTVSSSAMAA